MTLPKVLTKGYVDTTEKYHLERFAVVFLPFSVYENLKKFIKEQAKATSAIVN